MIIDDYKNEIEFSDDERVRKALFSGDHCRATLFCLKSGQSIKPHTHGGDHIWIVKEGSGWYLSEEGEARIKDGSVIFAPEGIAHGVRAESELVFISVSAGS